MPDMRQDIEAEIPRLRRYARALLRDVAAADDLVQDCLVRAVAKLHLWQEGSNLRAWLFTILHNQHINRIPDAVRAGATVELGDTDPRLIRLPIQDKCVELRDFDRALARLPEEQRTVILLAGLEGMRYHEVGAVLGVPIGTVRSRISRGRQALRHLMDAGAEQHPGHPDTARRRAVKAHRHSHAVSMASRPAVLANVAD